MGREQAIRLPMTGPNMLAALAGRKWMTRRVMKPQPTPCSQEAIDRGWARPRDYEWASSKVKSMVDLRDAACLSPYGVPGDPLALTETWKPLAVRNGKALIHYRADHSKLWQPMPECAHEKITRARKHGRWMPPMFMQAWASRMPVVNEEVRVERVQAISEKDAKAEGCDGAREYDENTDAIQLHYAAGGGAHKAEFIHLWDSINAKRGYSWETNHWVWVVSFRKTG